MTKIEKVQAIVYVVCVMLVSGILGVLAGWEVATAFKTQPLALKILEAAILGFAVGQCWQWNYNRWLNQPMNRLIAKLMGGKQ